MSESDEARDPIEALAEEFVNRHRQGQKPSLQEYVDKYPHLADDIRDLFPALLKMEKVRPQTGDATGEFTGGIRAAEKKLERLGDYRILREVGRGGMGIVYEAEQESLGRHVALKVLPHHALLDSKHLQRFHREAKAAARLHHTNIVPVYGVGADDGLHYYVMQFIQGMGLDEVLADLKRLRKAKTKTDLTLPNRDSTTPKSQGEPSAAGIAAALLTGEFNPRSVDGARSPDDHEGGIGQPDSRSSHTGSTYSDSSVQLPGLTEGSTLTESGRQYWQSVARIGIQVADALAYAHGQGTLHRDIKPSNLLLDNQGTVWVTDFGLAKASDSADLTHTGDIVGTVRYMAPERFKGLSDARSDIYSLGLTLYELLALRPAFAESDRNRLIRQVTHEEPPRPRKLEPEVPRDLETVVLKAISKEPAHRYGTAVELAADLQRFVEDKPVHARRVSARERLWRWCRRNPGLASAISLAAVLLLAVTFISTWFAVAKSEFAAAQSDLNRDLAKEQKQALAEKERAENASRDLAEALEKSQRLSALMAIEKGQTLMDLRQTASAMVWLARGLELAPAEAHDLQELSRGALASLNPEVSVLKRVIAHNSPIFALAVSPDGKTILTGGGNYLSNRGDAQLWDLATGKPVGPSLKHENFVTTLAFSPDGKKVLTASLDRTARLWDVATGQPIGPPLRPGQYIFSAAFSPDGKWVFTGGVEQGQLWDAATAKPKGPLITFHGIVYAAAYSPDGKMVVTGSNSNERTGELRFWRADPFEPIDPPIRQPNAITSVAFSPDGSQVVWGGLDGIAHLLDTATRTITEPIFRHLGPIVHVSFSPDGQWIVTAGNGALRLWDAKSGQPVLDPLPQNSFSRGAALAPDGRTLVIPRTERTIGIWELPLGRLTRLLLPHPAEITAVAFSPDGKTILTGCGQSTRGEAQVWDSATGQPLGPPLRTASPVTSVGFRHDGRTLVATPQSISANDNRGGPSLGQPLAIQSASVAFSADGKTAVVGADMVNGVTQNASLLDLTTGKPVGARLILAGRFSALDIDSKGEKVVTASGDMSRGELQFWNARDGKKIGAPLDYASRVLVVRLAPDGQTAVSGHYDSQALLWNVALGKRQGPALIHQGPVQAAAFGPDGQFLVTGSVDQSARVWHVKTGQPLGPPLRHAAPVTAVAVSPDGAWILTGCADGLARIWQGPTPSSGSDLVRNIPVVTGLTLSDQGELGHLEGHAWQDLKDRIGGATHPIAAAATDLSPSLGRDRLTWDLQQSLLAIDVRAWKAARWHLDRQIRVNPKDWLALLLRSRISVEQNQLLQAAADTDLAIRTGPVETILPWLRMYSGEAELKEQWAEALWYLDRLVAARPDDWSTHVDRARIFAKLSKWNEAVDSFDKALAAKKDDPNLWLERGRVFVKLEKWDRVAADFAKGIALFPETQSVADQRSQICAELAQWDKAMNMAVKLMPRGSDLWIAAGRHHVRLSHWDQAAADYARADWNRALGDDAFEYACLFLIRGDVDGYRKFYERLIERAGQTKDSFEAFVLARIGGMAPPGILDSSRAVQWGKQAVDSGPRVSWYVHALAMAHYRAGQFDIAVQRLQESQSGNWVSVADLNYFGLALAEYRLGHLALARESLAQGMDWLQKMTPAKSDALTTLFATDWLEAQLLRREAEDLINAKPGSP
jgi:WD40 repeat protein/serine/threonine protein kinase